MRAARFHKAGGPEVLVCEVLAAPSPRAGEVLIRVEAVGLNFWRRGDGYPDSSSAPCIEDAP